jgi:hypothetical protein
MLPLSFLFEHSLRYGLLLSIWMSGIIFASLYLCPKIWLGDAPPDIQQAVGPMSPRDQQIKRWLGLVTMGGVVALLVHSIVRLTAQANGHANFFDVALSSFLIIQVFNVVDLVLIDWLVVVTLRPSFVLLPGTEHLAGYRDYGFHFRAFLKGVAGSFLASLGIAAVTIGVAQIVGV